MRRFRFTIDVSPQEGENAEEWLKRFAAATVKALRDTNGSLWVDENGKPFVDMKELREMRSN